MRILWALLILSLTCSAQVYKGQPTLPIQPLLSVDTTYPSTGTYFTKTVGSTNSCGAGGTSVCDFSSINTAVSNAVCGEIISIRAGQTFTENITGTNHSCDSTHQIILISSSASIPAIGVRATSSDAVNMPLIQTATNNTPVFNAAASSSYYRLVGLEISHTGAATIFDDALVRLGNGEATYALQPSHIIVDRCYIHGTTASTSVVRIGVALQGAYEAVINSTIKEIHQTGADAQAIVGYQGPGPYLISNNRLEGSGENVMFGGAAPVVSLNVPSDITITRNYFYKPLTWKTDDPSYLGTHWSVKNLLEFKQGRRVLIDGNVFENNWATDQTGTMTLVTPRCDWNPGPCNAGWVTVQDLTYTHNIFRHSSDVIDMSAQDTNQTSSGVVLRGFRLLFQNNLIQDMDATAWGGGDGGFYRVFGNFPYAKIDHNTGVSSATALVRHMVNCASPDTNTPGFIFTNNLNIAGTYSILCSGGNAGKSDLDAFFAGYIFDYNVIYAIGASYQTALNGVNAHGAYPAAAANVGFTDATNCTGGTFSASACTLTNASTYHNAASDGTDIGADISSIITATSGVTP